MTYKPILLTLIIVWTIGLGVTLLISNSNLYFKIMGWFNYSVGVFAVWFLSRNFFENKEKEIPRRVYQNDKPKNT